MTGYDFHPEARADLDEIYDYIAEDNPDAADSVIAGILAAVRALVPLPHRGHLRSGPYLAAPAVHPRPSLFDCLRSGRKASMGRRCRSRQS
jgi:plasmid stabilization system protein ParE